MAIPVAAVAAAASLASSAGGVYAQGKMNRATREWNEKMYLQQRHDAYRDWTFQNEYNSPQKQMERLRAAGLNPNLVYDNGATHTAAPIRSVEQKNWSPQMPDVAGIGKSAIEGLGAFTDYTLQQEQVKNMQAQRANMQLDSLLKSIEISGNQVRNARTSLELSKAKDLYDTSIATAEEQLRNLTTSTDVKISQEVRNAALHAPNLTAAFQRVAQLATNTAVAQQQLDNLKKTGVLQQMEINLRKLGLSYSDGVILRVLAQFAGGQSLPEVVKNLWTELKNLAGKSKDDLNIE